MNFSSALLLLKQGLIMTRLCTACFWKIEDNYIVAYTYVGGEKVPTRFLTSTDILANDWETFREIDFKEIILHDIKSFPKDWREGQKVYNFINLHFGNIARKAQNEGIDCFLNDANIDIFISKCYKLLISVKD